MVDLHALKPLLSEAQLSEKIGVKRSWLAKARMSGDGPAFLKIGGRVLYVEAQVIEWLNSCTQKTTIAK